MVLFIRACVETHRLRTLRGHGPRFIPASDDTGGEHLPEVAVVQKQGNNPVIVPVSVAGQGGTTDVYMVTGPDGRPQLLAPVGTRLMIVPSEGGQQVAAAEAGSAQIYELNVPGPRVNELDARY